MTHDAQDQRGGGGAKASYVSGNSLNVTLPESPAPNRPLGGKEETPAENTSTAALPQRNKCTAQPIDRLPQPRLQKRRFQDTLVYGTIVKATLS